MKRWYSIDVHARWSVPFQATPAQVADMRADGLVIDEIIGTAPTWLPSWAVKPWLRMQAGWQWLRLF